MRDAREVAEDVTGCTGVDSGTDEFWVDLDRAEKYIRADRAALVEEIAGWIEQLTMGSTVTLTGTVDISREHRQIASDIRQRFRGGG